MPSQTGLNFITAIKFIGHNFMPPSLQHSDSYALSQSHSRHDTHNIML